jgi:Arm domain-containing DNA-binding protein
VSTRYRLNGNLEKVALGKYPALSLKAARQKRDELATMVAQGQSPAKQKQLRKVSLATETTVREFGERYFADVVTRDRKDTKIMRAIWIRALPDPGRQAHAGSHCGGRAAFGGHESGPGAAGTVYHQGTSSHAGAIGG